MIKDRLLSTLPLLILAALLTLCWFGLHRNPHLLPSTRVNSPLPAFKLPTTTPGNILSDADLKGHLSLLIFWGSWCKVCQTDQAKLMTIAATHSIALYSIAYKDPYPAVQSFLDTFGDPFIKTGLDKVGKVALDFGVYGAPETFLVDKQGLIRYKHIGIMTDQIWATVLTPLIQELRQG